MKYIGSCKRALKRFLMLNDLNGSCRYYKDGLWEVCKGAYDLWWEISYNKTPVIGCISGEVESYQKEFDVFAKMIVTDCNYLDNYGQKILFIGKE